MHVYSRTLPIHDIVDISIVWPTVYKPYPIARALENRDGVGAPETCREATPPPEVTHHVPDVELGIATRRRVVQSKASLQKF